MSGIRRRPCWASIAAILAALTLGTLAPAGARADTIDIALDAFFAAGQAAGVSLGPAERTVAKSLVRCAAAGRPVLACARDEVTRPLLAQVPADVRPVAECLLRGTPAQKCATDEVLRRLPAEARGIAECIGAGRDLATCGRSAASDALTQAFGAIDALQVDAAVRNPMLQGGRSIQNIVCTVQAVDRGDWAKIVECGGREVAKAVYKAVLQAFVPVPGLVAVLNGVIDGMIERRMDIVVEIMKAARPPNTRRLAEIAAEAYILLGTPIGQAATVICDFLPSGALKEIVCGAIGDAVRWATKAPGAIADGIGAAAQDVAMFLGGNQCRAAPEFFQDVFGGCIPMGVSQMVEWSLSTNEELGRSNYNRFEHEVYAQCRRNVVSWYERGLFGSTGTSQCASHLCDPLRGRFGDQVHVTAQAVMDTAYAFGRAAQYTAPLREVGSSGRWQCQRWGAEAQFQSECMKALERQFPYLVARSGGPTCNLWGTQQSGSGALFMRICNRVLERVGKNRIECECPEKLHKSRGANGEDVCLPFQIATLPPNLDRFLPLTESPSSLSTSTTLDSTTRPLPALLFPEGAAPPPPVSFAPGMIQPPPAVLDRAVAPEPLPEPVPAVSPPPVVVPDVQRRTCDVAACRAAFRSFRESDCTYQPAGGGPRLYCDRTVGPSAQPQQPVLPITCPRDRPVGTPPNCCPQGTQFAGGVCRMLDAGRPGSGPQPFPQVGPQLFPQVEPQQRACSGGMIGRPGNCTCPPGTQFSQYMHQRTRGKVSCVQQAKGGAPQQQQQPQQQKEKSPPDLDYGGCPGCKPGQRPLR